jgi:hypothetical protein
MAVSIFLTAWSTCKATWQAISNVWSRGRKSIGRMNDLETRISTLEDRLKKQPPDACLFCGELAMRMWYSGPPILDRMPISRIEDWRCSSCGKEERRARIYDR